MMLVRSVLLFLFVLENVYRSFLHQILCREVASYAIGKAVHFHLVHAIARFALDTLGEASLSQFQRRGANLKTQLQSLHLLLKCSRIHPRLASSAPFCAVLPYFFPRISRKDAAARTKRGKVEKQVSYFSSTCCIFPVNRASIPSKCASPTTP